MENTQLSNKQICGAFTLLGNELHRAGLLDEKWKPIKRNKLKGIISPLDMELVSLFTMMEGYALSKGVSFAERAYKYTANAIESLPEDEKGCNITLASIYLFSLNTIALPLHMKQTDRAIDGLIKEVLEEGGRELVTFSYRVADNISLLLDGKTIRTKEQREAFVTNKLVKKI